MDTNLQIQFSFQGEDAQEAVAALQQAGATGVRAINQRGFTGIEVVVIGLVASGGLTNLITRITRLWKCGVIVDTRGPVVQTTKDCSLPRGSVIFINKQGVETKLDAPTDMDLKPLVEAALAGVK